MQSKQLVIIICGNNIDANTNLAKYIYCEFLNKKIGKQRFSIEKINKDIFLVDLMNQNKIISIGYPNELSDKISSDFSIKTYRIQDVLKTVCSDLFGIDKSQCYGEDSDSYTHIFWDDMPTYIRNKYLKKRKGIRKNRSCSGPMTIFELIKVFGEDICKKIDKNCMARSLYSKIELDNMNLSIVLDAQIPTEVSIGTEIGGKAIKLIDRSDDTMIDQLKGFSDGEYNLVVENDANFKNNVWPKVLPNLNIWFNSYGVFK